MAGRGELLRPPPAAFRFSTRNPAGRGAIGDCGWRQAAGRSVFNLLQSPGINRLGGEQPTAARCAADASRRIPHKFSGRFPRREAWLQAGGVSFEINHEMHPVLISGAGFPSPGWGVNGIWCSWMGGRGVNPFLHGTSQLIGFRSCLEVKFSVWALCVRPAVRSTGTDTAKCCSPGSATPAPSHPKKEDLLSPKLSETMRSSQGKLGTGPSCRLL